DEDISALLSAAESGKAGSENKQSIESVEGGQDGAQQELAQVVPGGARTQATIKGAPLKGEAGGEAQPADGGTPGQPPPPHRGTAAAPATETASEPSGNGQRAGGGRMIVSPIAARMAAEEGINLNTLAGSGPGGRIIKRDIETAMSQRAQPPQPTTTAPAAPTSEVATPAPQQQPAAARSFQQQQPRIEGGSPFRDEPVSKMRSVIARRLVTSIGPVPHFFLTAEIEMDRAADLRRQLNELDKETKISFNDIILKVAAVALVQHPQVNASFQEQAIRYYERADIGVAVAIEDGLITPVVRAAERKSIGQISREVRALAERARQRKLTPEEYTGGTFSVSNLGMFGIDEFTGVINPPEAAILAVGAVQPKPVARDGEVLVRQMMRVTMSCDHRVIDGATGAQFLQTFKQTLENPLLLML
ncbi:MAG: dihydrolipoamide acetyltransferase family protein, partial [Pyrinomonadaceae bacterium]